MSRLPDPPWPGDEEPGGFWVNRYPDPRRKPTLGEDLDFRFELDDQAWDAISDQVGRLEARIMVLEDVATVLEAVVFEARSTLSRGNKGVTSAHTFSSRSTLSRGTERSHMRAVKIAGAVAGAVAAGVYLRWATGPVRGAYRLGRGLPGVAK